jgi:hypothetical protein
MFTPLPPADFEGCDNFSPQSIVPRQLFLEDTLILPKMWPMLSGLTICCAVSVEEVLHAVLLIIPRSGECRIYVHLGTQANLTCNTPLAQQTYVAANLWGRRMYVRIRSSDTFSMNAQSRDRENLKPHFQAAPRGLPPNRVRICINNSATAWRTQQLHVPVKTISGESRELSCCCSNARCKVARRLSFANAIKEIHILKLPAIQFTTQD